MDFSFDLQPGNGQPEQTFQALREAGPVVWSEAMQSWIVSSYDAVREVLSDVSRFTSEGTPVAEVFGTEGMLTNDTPMHHTVRGVWARHVGVAALTARREELTDYARQALRAALPALEAGETVDLVPVFQNFVRQVIASSFGVAPEHMDVFHQWSEASAATPALEMEEGSPEHARHFAAREAVFAMIDAEVASRKKKLAAGEAPDDLIALMVAAEGKNGITSSIVADNLFNFSLGALDTSEKFFGNIVCRLYGDPALKAEIAADPGLIEAMNDEVMRFSSVAQTIQRRVRNDGTQLGGQTLNAGDAIMVMLGAANRDAGEFPDPDRFDPHRRNKAHLGFGFGFHHCLGLNIAKQEAIALVIALLDVLPQLEIVEVDYGPSWALLGPGALHVRLPVGD